MFRSLFAQQRCSIMNPHNRQMNVKYRQVYMKKSVRYKISRVIVRKSRHAKSGFCWKILLHRFIPDPR